MPAPLAPTPQLGNKSPPVSCDPSEFPPLALVPSPPGGLSAPLLGQVGLRTKAKRSVSRAGCGGRSACEGSRPVVAQAPGESWAQAGEIWRRRRAGARRQGHRVRAAQGSEGGAGAGRRGGTRPGDLTNDRGAKTDRQSPRQTRRQGR